MNVEAPSLSARLTAGVWPDLAAYLAERLPEWGEPPPERQIFVNRTLRMESICCVGFDLDWTLADYRRLPLEQLTFELAIGRLIDHHGYPEAIRALEFRPDFPRRGLLIDKEAGTVLRMSRHRFVNLAYFGRQRLDRRELKRLYRYEPIQPASERFYHLDSLFELPEANLYAELIDLANVNTGLPLPSSRNIFEDVRGSIDWVHASGVLKSKVLADLPRFLDRDPELGLALARLALAGRRLILLTNSDWAYAQAICSHLLDDAIPGLRSWREVFDLVVVEAGKPEFFRTRRAFEALGDDGEPQQQADRPEWYGLYRRGCLEGLMQLIGEPGESVLYVGDHIYGDIVSSKLESTWRTALIARELEDEIRHQVEFAGEVDHGVILRQQLAELGHEMDHLRDLIMVQQVLEPQPEAEKTVLPSLRRRHAGVVAELQRSLQQEAAWSEQMAARFNPYWGSFFKQGTSKTRFASQLEAYACLYTSRLTNFAYYGSSRYFRVTWDPMMHELRAGENNLG